MEEVGLKGKKEKWESWKRGNGKYSKIEIK